MKYAIFIVFWVIASPSFGQGIVFETSGFQLAKEKAKSENKLIFMDAYTTWCGPCKWMSRNVFTDANVGSYYNDKFINIKVDMERGEGVDLAELFEVEAYPTLLFIDGNGKLVHRSTGSRPAEDFLDLGKAANDPNRQYATMKRRFDGGERSASFLKQYVDVLTSTGMKDFDHVAELYMNTQKDWTTEENMQFIFDYSEASMDSKLFQYSMENRGDFVQLIGEEKFNQKADYAAEQDRTKAGIAREEVDKLKVHYAKYFPTEKANALAMVSYFNQNMYNPDPVEQEKFIAEIQLFLASRPDAGWSFYNAVAWHIYETSDDRALLTKAVEWAKWSLEENKNSFNTDTVAALLYKLGNKDEARPYAEESIQLAKQNGYDYSSTSELLEKINQ